MDLSSGGHVLAKRMLGLRSNGGQGSVITIKRVIGSSYDPTTGDEFPVQEEYVSSGYRSKYSRAYKNKDSEVLIGDAKFMLSNSLLNGDATPIPKVGDVYTHEGVDWIVIAFEEYAPAGMVFYYEVQGRKL